jgi:hypothetical protein
MPASRAAAISQHPGFSMPNFWAFQDVQRLFRCNLGSDLFIIEKGVDSNPVFIYSGLSQTLEHSSAFVQLQYLISQEYCYPL